MALENELNELNLKETSELEGVAKQMFEDIEVDGVSSIDLKTNLQDEEVGLCMINDIIFKQIGLPELSPTKQFKRLVSSRGGWKTEKFVQTAGGIMGSREGSSMMGRIGSMFQPRQ